MLYAAIVSRFSWWPIHPFQLRGRSRSNANLRLAYYLWKFPTLSETFIQRDVAALKECGLSVEVIADAPGDLELLDANANSFVSDTHYLLPVNQARLLKYVTHFLSKNPLLFCSLFIYVATHTYGSYKSFKLDVEVFLKAVFLAGTLRDKSINHIHSPWADMSAFTSLIASRLVGVPYSVEARAHDLHRRSFVFALREKFDTAAFVITHAKYNEPYLQSILPKRQWDKIHVIYNGVHLANFQPLRKPATFTTQIKLLCVARLIEQKGLVYLLRACRILKDRGHAFNCHIIGGPEKPLYANYYHELREMHRTLELEDCVFLLGPQSFTRVLEEYNTADIFVLPCVIAEDGSRDMTPNVLIEAMAMKLPVVSTTVTGIPEIVDEGVNGLLVPPHEAGALAEAVVKLAVNARLRDRLGQEARAKIEARFDSVKNAAGYIELFTGRT